MDTKSRSEDAVTMQDQTEVNSETGNVIPVLDKKDFNETNNKIDANDTTLSQSGEEDSLVNGFHGDADIKENITNEEYVNISYTSNADYKNGDVDQPNTEVNVSVDHESKRQEESIDTDKNDLSHDIVTDQNISNNQSEIDIVIKSDSGIELKTKGTEEIDIKTDESSIEKVSNTDPNDLGKEKVETCEQIDTKSPTITENVQHDTKEDASQSDIKVLSSDTLDEDVSVSDEGILKDATDEQSSTTLSVDESSVDVIENDVDSGLESPILDVVEETSAPLISSETTVESTAITEADNETEISLPSLESTTAPTVASSLDDETSQIDDNNRSSEKAQQLQVLSNEGAENIEDDRADDKGVIEVETRVSSDETTSALDDNSEVDVSADKITSSSEDKVESIAPTTTSSTATETVEKSLPTVIPEAIPENLEKSVAPVSNIDVGKAENVKEENTEKKDPHSKGEEEVTTSEPIKKDEWMDILGNGLLKKKVVIPGDGEGSRPKTGQLVTVRCTGTLQNGKVIDISDSLTFILGDEDVIQAFDLGVALMELNEVAILFTDARYAYSIYGRPDSKPPIPQNVSITYNINLMKVEDGPGMAGPIKDYERVLLGDKKRERGNNLYQKGDFSGSINQYKRGLKYLDGSTSKDVLVLKVKCLNNLSAAQLKVEAYDAALQSLEKVLDVEPENVKALFRQAKCLEATQKEEEALTVLKKASMLSPTNKLILQDLNKLRSKLAVTYRKEKAMYQKMFKNREEKLKDLEDEGSSWMYILSASAVAVGGILLAALWARNR